MLILPNNKHEASKNKLERVRIMINLSLYSYIKPPTITSSLIDDCRRFLEDNEKIHTWAHSFSVSKTCIELAERFGLDKDITEASALLHDISSVMKPSHMMDYAVNSNWYIDEAEKKYPFLLHQRMSSVFAEDVFNIKDKSILSMISRHTTLHESPSDYDMLLFISDKLSWDQEDVPPYFDVVYKALDCSLSYASLVYINFVMENGMILYPHQWLINAKSFLESVKH